MYSASRSLRAVSLLFVACFLTSTAFPQGVNFIRHVADPLPLANLSSARPPCATNSGKDFSASNAASPATDCASPPRDIPTPTILPVNPCASVNVAQPGCNPPRDIVQEDLATRGKQGQKILRARERVLEILQSENACSAWFREKSLDPAGIFRTLSFEIDRKGDGSVQESKTPGGATVYRSPYVARVIQADGSYGTITLNLRGAFFAPMAALVQAQWEGGPLNPVGARSIGVGPYGGDTLHGQVLALLHEFGHIVDLLPSDRADEDGKSVQNTNEVLRYCRAEVESKNKHATLLAVR